ncbi:metal ABC transporter substrate-binding protein [Paracoccus tegillarcae]|uniref:Iron ABC transporter substrate-binding protein n=1 Tax=Paracoccus tegillarcae TaxID=1529068 RepID=A0A2K9F0J3_9RHOB|nr:metal ABC transporter substrate-binding protein [Paracoccus tegillarcae]AUH32015.1 iron ABC transporter substrate-binding protein [Paracoccus tegillarcae]AUH35084.1 iron ABC transporter substrate-binding protein [Paracoccus tegillarcae]
MMQSLARPPLRLAALAVLTLLTALPVQAQDQAQDQRLKVSTSFTIIADMARNVAGDVADVEAITRPGADIHNYQPTAGDMIRASDAGLILVNGMNLEAWFQQFIDKLGDIPVAVVSDGVEPIAISGGSYDGKPNPHAWMALDSALIYVDNIVAALSTADPDNAATYRANGDSYKQQISEAIAPLRDAAKNLPDNHRWLVTSEGAFSYLARDFGLSELFLWPINADGQGTPQQVRRVIDTVRDQAIPVIFSESTVSDRPARAVAGETGARYGGQLYVDSLSEADGPVPTYLELLRTTSDIILSELQK